MTINRSKIKKQIENGDSKMMKKKGYKAGGKVKTKGMKKGGKVKGMNLGGNVSPRKMMAKGMDMMNRVMMKYGGKAKKKKK